MITINDQSPQLGRYLEQAVEFAQERRIECFTPEVLLRAICHDRDFSTAVIFSGGFDVTQIEDALDDYIYTYLLPGVPDDMPYDGPEPSASFIETAQRAIAIKLSSEAKHVELCHVLRAMHDLESPSQCRRILDAAIPDFPELLSYLAPTTRSDSDEDDLELPFGDELDLDRDSEWQKYALCLNDNLAGHNPLVGRQAELERTMQVLCRKDKNNPLHVGEPGVGKTALAYGLAAAIERGDVPQPLRGSKVYALDMGALIAGTHYRGDFEKRLKSVLNALSDLGNAILYIDEVHTVVGAGMVDGGTLDASNILKPYLEQGRLRVIGATTYDEYNKTLTRAKAFHRRFQKIDIEEPTVEQTAEILLGLKDRYEAHHGVRYTDEALAYAAQAAAKYITGRYLPDKAIDLIDEAGAWLRMHPAEGAEQVVDKPLVAEVLARVCHVDMLAEHDDDNERLLDLDQRIRAQIYGQDSAVAQVAEAVQMGAAGLIDDNKPMASLLFVGPTGVGKTEVARVLAAEMGVPLVRFDMSEYAEKHTVAKLIGAPAGYVGYDDGGLLTTAISKTPHCVLLFDELEKAHPDIYNVLLQVMDYAMLTDSHGQKADFRHVVFIMTTNAGAQDARLGALGYVNDRSAGQAMMKTVKRTFKPEFLNRLTAITMFADMDRGMAERVLDKKLRQLADKLAKKGVELRLTDEARALLLDQGFSAEYGGREVDRVITSTLKPLLTRAVLFGALRHGGVAQIDREGDHLTLL